MRLSYLSIALVSWILSGFGLLFMRRTIVLCYHGVDAEQADRFQKQMMRLKLRLKNSGKLRALPAVWITFDDAFANLLDNALPVLEKCRIPAIVFAVAGNLGGMPHWKMPVGHHERNEKTMTKDQLTFLSRHPLVKIGSHTVTHPNLVEISPQQARNELADSKQQLEVVLGCSVEEFALPHGAYNEVVLAMAQEVGYKRVYTLDPKPVDLESGGAVIGRFSMSPDVWKIEFMLTCAGAYAWLRPWRRFVRQARGLT